MCRLKTSILAASLLLLITITAGALEMDAVAGFGGVCKTGTWTPVTVRIKNSTSEKVSGSIAFLNPISGEPTSTLTPFEVSSSEKRYTHYVMTDATGGEATIALIPDSGWKRVTKKIQITSVDDNSVLMVAAGPQRATLNFLSGEKLKVLGTSQSKPSPASPGPPPVPVPVGDTIFTALTDPTLIPDRPLGYDGVYLLAISELAPDRIDPKQLTAIKMWVSSGGILVVNGGANYQSFQNSFYADILPVDVTGSAQLLNISAIQARFGQPMQAGPIAVTSGRLKPGATATVSQNGVPLISTWEYGLGRVYFLAFDYSSFPFKGWDGQVALWRSMANKTDTRFPFASPASFVDTGYGGYGGPPTPAPAIQQKHNIKKVYNRNITMFNNPIESLTGSLPQIKTPSFNIILVFLIAYLICLVPLNYFIFAKKRRELAWITTPAIIIVFTLSAYGIGYGMKGGKLILKTVSIIEAGPNSQYASATSYSGLFSPSRRSYDLLVADPFGVVAEARDDNPYYGRSNDRSPMPEPNVILAETTTLQDVKMNMWSMRSFRRESACDMGGTLTADLKLDSTGQRLSGTVHNDTDFDIRDCAVVVDDKFVAVGNIGAKSSKTVDGSLADDMPFITPPSPMPYQSTAQDTPVGLRTALMTSVIPYVKADGGMALIGWSKKNTTEITLTRGREENINTNCLVFWLPENGGSVR